MRGVKLFYLNLILILAFWILFFSLYDIIFGRDWMLIVFVSYAVLMILIITIILHFYGGKSVIPISVEEFEKSLKGGLYHFKCPSCNGIFAIKKSKGNNNKPIKMTCPDCGKIGIVPSNPHTVEEEIPEKKSVKASFKCNVCGEGVTIWAEGTNLYRRVAVYTCPFCGEQKPLKKL